MPFASNQAMNPEICFRGMGSSDALAALVGKKALGLSKFHGGILACRAVIEARRAAFHARVEVHVPGSEVIAGQALAEDAYLAVRAAFQAARRRLEDYVRVRHGFTKVHPPRVRLGAALLQRRSS